MGLSESGKCWTRGSSLSWFINGMFFKKWLLAYAVLGIYLPSSVPLRYDVCHFQRLLLRQPIFARTDECVSKGEAS